AVGASVSLFVLKGCWRIVTGLVLDFLAVVGSSVLWAGWDSHVTWYRESILPFASKSMDSCFASKSSCCSMTGNLSRLSPGRGSPLRCLPGCSS
ncbi:MAG: hypothetical protein ACXW39_01845, partial [Nitrospira sp.]